MYDLHINQYNRSRTQTSECPCFFLEFYNSFHIVKLKMGPAQRIKLLHASLLAKLIKTVRAPKNAVIMAVVHGVLNQVRILKTLCYNSSVKA